MEPQSNFEEIREYKTVISRLETQLQQKEIELSSIRNLYDDLKKFNENLRKQVNEDNAKIIALRNELQNKEKNYENQLASMKSDFDKKEEIYQEKITKMSAYNPDGQRNKIKNEIAIEFNQILMQKDNEIEQQQNVIKELNSKYELLLAEYETFKNDALREINTQREVHKTEMNNLLNKIQIQSDKTGSNIDKDIFREMKNELDQSRHQISELTSEVEKLRREKESLTIERNDIKLNTMKDNDKEKFNNKVLFSENERNKNLIENMKNEIQNYKSSINRRDIEIKDLMNDKLNLVKQLHENEAEFQDLKSEVITLRNLIEVREKEMMNDIVYNEREKKESLFREKADKENYQKQIEDLSTQLKDVKINYKNYYEQATNELHSAQREFHAVNEEKKMLNKRINELLQELDILRSDYENKVRTVTNYQKEYENIESKYRDICRKNIELNDNLKEKNKQIESLNQMVNSFQKNGFVSSIGKNNNPYRDLMKKYSEAINKKKYYKEQCKIANSNIENIIKKLQPQQKEDLVINKDFNPMISQSDESGV
jgi:chromosome segregation ATPase